MDVDELAERDDLDIADQERVIEELENRIEATNNKSTLFANAR